MLFSERHRGDIELSGPLLAEAASAFVRDQEELAESKLRGPEEPDAPQPMHVRGRMVGWNSAGPRHFLGRMARFDPDGPEPPPYVTDDD